MRDSGKKLRMIEFGDGSAFIPETEDHTFLEPDTDVEVTLRKYEIRWFVENVIHTTTIFEPKMIHLYEEEQEYPLEPEYPEQDY